MKNDETREFMGKNLYEARINAHLTQEKLAELAGISSSYCTNLEHGRKGMSSDVLRRLADALKISADSILYGNDHGTHIYNILALLKDQPDSFLTSVENMIRFMLEERDRQEEARQKMSGEKAYL